MAIRLARSALAYAAVARRARRSLCTATSGDGVGDGAQHDSDLKKLLLDRALLHVPTHGWTDDCLTLATQELNLPPLAHQIVENGVGDLVCHFLRNKKEHVRQVMSAAEQDCAEGDAEKIEELKVVRGIEAHLEYVLPYRETWAEAMAVCADPKNLRHTLPLAFFTADELCYFANITGSRMDWYSQRGLMMALYVMTELHFLTDSTPNFDETRAFLRQNASHYRALRSSPSVMGFIRRVVLRF